MVPRRKFYSFYVRAAIDGEDSGMDYEIPETKPCTRLLLYLSLAGFACGFSLLNPSVAYAGEDDENSVCANSGRRRPAGPKHWSHSTGHSIQVIALSFGK